MAFSYADADFSSYTEDYLRPFFESKSMGEVSLESLSEAKAKIKKDLSFLRSDYANDHSLLGNLSNGVRFAIPVLEIMLEQVKERIRNQKQEFEESSSERCFQCDVCPYPDGHLFNAKCDGGENSPCPGEFLLCAGCLSDSPNYCYGCR